MKISYIGTELGFAVLERLLLEGISVHSVWYANGNGAKFRDLASKYKLNNIQVSGERISKENLIRMCSEGVDYILVNGYPHIIPIQDLPIRGINIHPTLLPEGRGQYPFQWTVLKDFKVTGITSHKLTMEMDAGEILFQSKITVEPEESLTSLICKFQIAAPDHVSTLITNVDSFWRNSAPQGNGSYWRDPERSDYTLDWAWSTSKIERTVRAFDVHGARARLDDRIVWIRRVRVWNERPTVNPGEILDLTWPKLVVTASDGYVLLEDFEFEETVNDSIL